MVEQTYDNITRVYDLRSLDEKYFPIRQVEKGFLLWKRTVTVPDRIGGLPHARALLTNDILDSVGEALGKKVELADISRDGLTQLLEEVSKKLCTGKVEFSMINGKNNVLGSINYSAGIKRSGYYGPYTEVGGGVELVVFGNTIENPGQFNALQQKL